jgi:MFS transporter, PAT family, beta-lactamase induction signal transducer AmpG
MSKTLKNNPWYWIPPLYLTEGIPYVLIITVSVIMYKKLGVDNSDIGLYTSFLYLPWVIKPLWSPLVDLYGTKRKWFLGMQLVLSFAFLCIGLSVPTDQFFVLTLAFFWLASFASATNDIASDGFYLLALKEEQQSFFIGLRSTFYRVAMVTGQGLFVIVAGFLEVRLRRQCQSMVIDDGDGCGFDVCIDADQPLDHAQYRKKQYLCQRGTIDFLESIQLLF